MTTHKINLINAIDNKQATVGIIGLGYVGLPLLLRSCEVGFKVIGFDIDDEKVNFLNNGQSYIEHISSDRIKSFLPAKNTDFTQGNFLATTDYTRAKDADILILCVPTPLNKYREPDLTYILKTLELLVPHLRKGQVVCLESTTYPGTTDEELAPRITEKGFTIGEDIFLVFSPEREDPGNPDFNTQTIPKVCGGYTDNCLDVGKAFYQNVVDTVVPVSSTKVAELTKILENVHRAVNIGLMNELKVVADKMGIDVFEAIHAAATKPFGFVPYYPGPGLGGHCIPIDPFYLTWKAREFGLHTRFIELAGEINESMPSYVISKTIKALNSRKKSMNGSKIIVLGIAYKKNVDDMRESPSVTIMEKLLELGASVDYSDPHVPSFPKMREHHFDLESIEITKDSLSKYDAVILSTDHAGFDYDLIEKYSNLIIDTRGRFSSKLEKVVKA